MDQKQEQINPLYTGTWSGTPIHLHQFHESNQNPIFDSFVNTLRLGLISAGLVGLFWILIGQLEEDRHVTLKTKPKKQRQNADVLVNLKQFILDNFKQEVHLYQPGLANLETGPQEDIDDLETQSLDDSISTSPQPSLSRPLTPTK